MAAPAARPYLCRIPRRRTRTGRERQVMTMGARAPIGITIGEPAGIGPEISIRAAWALRHEVRSVLIGDSAFLAMTAAAIDPAIRLVALSQMAVRNDGLPAFPADRIAVIDSPLAVPVVPGKLDPRNGRSVLQTLDIAIENALDHRVDAI